MSIYFANPKSGFKDKKSKILKKISTFIDSGEYVLGTEVRAFEKKFNQFLNNKGYFVSCANGTDAITLALLAHDISTGYVITPSHTAPASVLDSQKGFPVSLAINKASSSEEALTLSR